MRTTLVRLKDTVVQGSKDDTCSQRFTCYHRRLCFLMRVQITLGERLRKGKESQIDNNN
jgi:hypothetical protein